MVRGQMAGQKSSLDTSMHCLVSNVTLTTGAGLIRGKLGLDIAQWAQGLFGNF